MVKKSLAIVLALIMVVALSAACTGPPGQPGLPGPPGNPGQPGLPGSPGEVVQPMATITVMPASGTPTTPITVIGAGFKPGEEIEVEIVMEGVSMLIGYREMVNGERKQKHVANEDGTFRVISAIPRPASPGVYLVKATGDKGTVAVYPLYVTE